MRTVRLLALLVALLAAPALAAAQGESDDRSILHHVVQKGDSLELLAAEFYGDRQFAVFLMVANGMQHPRDLKPGETLRIPTAWKYQAMAGESLESLAQRFLGDKRRAPFLAEFNGLPKNATLATGQEVMIPFHVKHVAASKETLEQLAATFYGDAGKARLLKGYNFLSGRPLKKGESLIVPVIHVRIRESKLPAQDAEAAQRAMKRKEMEARAREVLPLAREGWLEGDFAQVKRTLAELDVDSLNADVAAESAFLLGAAYIAFGDEDSALVQFKKVLERKPDYRVHARDVSPKITAVWEEAGGRVER